MTPLPALNIARESIKGMQEKCEQGWYPAKAPIGYKNVVDAESTGSQKRKVLVPDPRARILVNRIYELRAKMLSYESIRLKCIEEGLIIDGKVRSASSIEKILKNPYYSGRFVWRGKWYDGKHELIISKGLFEAVQGTFHQSGVPYKYKKGVFSSWLKCSCGCKVTYDPKVKFIKSSNEKKVYNYYRCANGRHAHEKLNYISEEDIMNKLGEAVSRITITESLAQDISNALDEAHRRVQR